MRCPLGRTLVRLLLSSVVCYTAPLAWAEAEAPAVSPAINAYYADADVARWMRIFETPGREVFDKRFRILQATRARPGMVVADVGAGTGFFSLLFARAVGPEGKVYAIDPAENFLAHIRQRALAEYRVDNIETIRNDPRSTGLPPASVDLVFLCDTYHHFEYPRAMLASIAAALRDNGELVLIDYRRVPGEASPWVMSHVRAGQEEVLSELLAAGFELIEEGDFLRENYFLRLRKRPE